MPSEIFIVEHDLVLDRIGLMSPCEEEDVEDYREDEDKEEDCDLEGELGFAHLHSGF